MKKILCLIFFASIISAKAQTVAPDKQPVKNTRALLDSEGQHYNPSKAFAEYQQLAIAGNPEAMNALGILYSKGLGTEADAIQAQEWFEKAALNGYCKGWYNLGLLYKNGTGLSQDFKLAYESFSKGASANSGLGYYGKGFMLYKGLGCNQNYEEAFEAFQKGASLRNLGSMYMLGLCYRNGYGRAVNPDSAGYWLTRAAAGGFKLAADELNTPEPENSQVAQNINPDLQARMKLPETAEGKSPAIYREVQHKVKQGELTGFYTGYAIKYDWSGKHVIGQSKLTLQLNEKNKEISGVWVENEDLTTELKASFGEDGIIFSNTAYAHADHYSTLPVAFEFKEARLELIRSGESLYLAGNVQLYSPTRREPEKPMYISLVKADVQNISDVAVLNTKELVVYPNPFTNTLQVSFTLEQSSKLDFSLLDMKGKVVHTEKSVQLEPGSHSRSLQVKVPVGAYVLKISSNGSVTSTVVIKK